jgi:hypothetical protein
MQLTPGQLGRLRKEKQSGGLIITDVPVSPDFQIDLVIPHILHTICVELLAKVAAGEKPSSMLDNEMNLLRSVMSKLKLEYADLVDPVQKYVYFINIVNSGRQDADNILKELKLNKADVSRSEIAILALIGKLLLCYFAYARGWKSDVRLYTPGVDPVPELVEQISKYILQAKDGRLS